MSPAFNRAATNQGLGPYPRSNASHPFAPKFHLPRRDYLKLHRTTAIAPSSARPESSNYRSNPRQQLRAATLRHSLPAKVFNYRDIEAPLVGHATRSSCTMADSTSYGSPSHGATPDGNSLLAQPPLQQDENSGDGEGNNAPNHFVGSNPSTAVRPELWILINHRRSDVRRSECRRTYQTRQ